MEPSQGMFVASHSSIAGYMDAMVMPFRVREQKMLEGLEPGMLVDFTLVVSEDDAYAENIQIRHYESVEQEPLRARWLQLLDNLDTTNAGASVLAAGQPVPDFALTDQTGQRVSLSQFAGKVVAVTFFYTSCPLPNYCFLLSNNFGQLQKRFQDALGKDLVFLSISINPVHDTPEVLAEYGKTWNADPESWHFLTGSLSDVKTVSRRFGVNYWPEHGMLTHTLHTVVIDRQGRLAANLEGNEFSAEQLGDFLATMLHQPN
jgi:protein SCO1/2